MGINAKLLMSNRAKGRTSLDSVSSGSVIEFINRNTSFYPTEVGSVQFELIPVKSQKDQVLNTARLSAQIEYKRIMEMVDLLNQQAKHLRRRLEISELIYSAEYKFKIIPGNNYYLVTDTKQHKTLLIKMGPEDWSAGKPDQYNYIAKVKCLGDFTWIELDQSNEIVSI